MPERLSDVAPNASIILCNAGHYPLEERPQLLPLAMRVITAWSTLEAFLAGTFVRMLGSAAPAGVAIFSSITSTAGQKDAMRAVADFSLKNSQELRDAFEALLALFATAAKMRNKIAHWIWGYSPNLADSILLAEPEVMVKFRLSDVANTEAVRRGERPEIVGPDRTLIYVYGARDFAEVIGKIERLSSHFMQFEMSFLRHEIGADDSLFRDLCSEPDIAPELSRLRERRRKSQEAQQPRPPQPPQAEPPKNPPQNQ